MVRIEHSILYNTLLNFRVLFQGKNDFMICLQESFPQLKTTMMTRVEWCQIRRLMGKPRRCSQVCVRNDIDSQCI